MTDPVETITRPGRLHATCGGCDAEWTSLSLAHCATCHHSFGSVSSFDRHRKGGRCAHPTALGLVWNPVRHCWSQVFVSERPTP